MAARQHQQCFHFLVAVLIEARRGRLTVAVRTCVLDFAQHFTRHVQKELDRVTMTVKAELSVRQTAQWQRL